MIKILLIGPSTKEAITNMRWVTAPLGVHRIASFLKKHDIYVEIWDINIDNDSIETRINKKNWDIIGFSTLEATQEYDMSLIHLAKKLRSESILIAGGTGATLNYQEYFNKTPLNMVIQAEGEFALLQLCQMIEKYGYNYAPIHTISGAIIRNYAKILTPEDYWNISKDLDVKDMKASQYWNKTAQLYDNPDYNEINTFRLYTSNFCPMGCAFCTLSKLRNYSCGKYTPIVALTVDQIIYMIKKVLDEYKNCRQIFFCFHPKTEIYTINGLKKINEIKIGDTVLTHTGNWNKVTMVHEKGYTGKLYRIIGRSRGFNIEGTPNHKFFVKDNKTNKHTWKEIQYIDKNDRLLIPIEPIKSQIRSIDLSEYVDYNVWKFDKEFISKSGHNVLGNKIPRFLKIDDNLMRLFGYYIAEGHCTSHTVNFSFHQKETSYINDVKNITKLKFNLNAKIYHNKKQNVTKVTICSSFLPKLFRHLFGTHAVNKQISNILMIDDSSLLLNLLLGLFRGDGNKVKNSKTKSGSTRRGIRYFTISSKLAFQITQICSKLNVVANIYRKNRGNYIDRKNKIWKSKPIYTVKINTVSDFYFSKNEYSQLTYKFKNFKAWSGEIKDNYVEIRIKSIDTFDYDGKVYNLSVENDHSYNVYGIAVKNCDDDFFILKQRGIDFCKKIIELKDKGKLPDYLRFICLTNINRIDESNIDLIVKAGFKVLSIGVESVSQHVLDSLDKKQTVERIWKTTELILNRGIKPYYTLLMFTSFCNFDDLIIDILGFKKLGKMGVGLSVEPYLIPLKGTKLSEEGVSERKRKIYIEGTNEFVYKGFAWLPQDPEVKRIFDEFEILYPKYRKMKMEENKGKHLEKNWQAYIILDAVVLIIHRLYGPLADLEDYGLIDSYKEILQKIDLMEECTVDTVGAIT